MSTFNKKRSSILKKRSSLASSNESSPTQSQPKQSKKINFSVKNNVKEFATQDERNTIWVNSYELSAQSSEESSNRFSQQKSTNSSVSVTLSSTKFSEIDKENLIEPLERSQSMPTNQVQHIISKYHDSVDMSLIIEERERSRLAKTENLSTSENTIHLLSEVNRLTNCQIENEDMDLTDVVEAVSSYPLGNHSQANLSISMQDEQIDPPVSEKVVFSTGMSLIANKFPVSFTRRLKSCHTEDDVSFSTFFQPNQPQLKVEQLLDDTNIMNISELNDGSDSCPKVPAQVRRNRQTIHFEHGNEMEETIVQNDAATLVAPNSRKTIYCSDDMSTITMEIPAADLSKLEKSDTRDATDKNCKTKCCNDMQVLTSEINPGIEDETSKSFQDMSLEEIKSKQDRAIKARQTMVFNNCDMEETGIQDDEVIDDLQDHVCKPPKTELAEILHSSQTILPLINIDTDDATLDVPVIKTDVVASICNPLRKTTYFDEEEYTVHAFSLEKNEIARDTNLLDCETQRASVRRTIVFDSATMEVSDLSTSGLHLKSSTVEIYNLSDMKINSELDIMEDSMRTSDKIDTLEANLAFSTMIISPCRAAPFRANLLDVSNSTGVLVMEKTIDTPFKTSSKCLTPSKIPVLKDRQTLLSHKAPKSVEIIRKSIIENISQESMLETESDPGVDLSEVRRVSSECSGQTMNFEKFKEKYLNLTMPRSSDVKIPSSPETIDIEDPKSMTFVNFSVRSSFGSMTNLKNYSTHSSVCSEILDDVREKVLNCRFSRPNRQSSEVGDASKFSIDWQKYENMMVSTKRNRQPLEHLLADSQRSMENLMKFEAKSNQSSPVQSEEFIGAIFPVAPSFTCIWKNFMEREKDKKLDSSILSVQIAPIYPLSRSFFYLLKNKITEELTSWIFDDNFGYSGLLELHHKLLKTIKMRIYLNKESIWREDAPCIIVERVCFRDSQYLSMIHKSLRRKLIHLEFMNRYPVHAVLTMTANGIVDFLRSIEIEITNIDKMVKRLYEICECFNVNIVERHLEVLLEKRGNFGRAYEISIVANDNCNLSGLTATCIKIYPESPIILQKLQKYTGLELIEVMCYEFEQINK